MDRAELLLSNKRATPWETADLTWGGVCESIHRGPCPQENEAEDKISFLPLHPDT